MKVVGWKPTRRVRPHMIACQCGNLCFFFQVPVFDLRDFYGCNAHNDVPHSMNRLVSMCARNNRFEGELPSESLVGVLCVPMKKVHLDHTDLSFNLVGAILLATPYGTSLA